jgi:hypothetical protein
MKNRANTYTFGSITLAKLGVRIGWAHEVVR